MWTVFRAIHFLSISFFFSPFLFPFLYPYLSFSFLLFSAPVHIHHLPHGLTVLSKLFMHITSLLSFFYLCTPQFRIRIFVRNAVIFILECVFIFHNDFSSCMAGKQSISNPATPPPLHCFTSIEYVSPQLVYVLYDTKLRLQFGWLNVVQLFYRVGRPVVMCENGQREFYVCPTSFM